MTKVAILQSNYIPWKGYFDFMNSVDHFVFYDTAQYTKNDWRNRNKIKTNSGIQWLTIPVSQTNLRQTIQETKVSSENWSLKHWKTICQNYSKAPYFHIYAPMFEAVYLDNTELFLSKINHTFIKLITDILDIKTDIHWSKDFNLIEGKSERLLNICRDLNASIYLSGPAAKDYLDQDLFEKNGIQVEWMDYSNYPQYEQLHPPFEHGVTILDLLFNMGPQAKNYMKSFNHDSV